MCSNIPVKFIQQNSPDGGFLQSPEWRKFQEAVGRKTFNITSPASTGVEAPSSCLPDRQAYEGEGGIAFFASIIEHKLPIVGRYFYIPRGPAIEVKNSKFKVQNDSLKLKVFLDNLIRLAKDNKAGWIRIDPADDKTLEEIKNNIEYKITKAPHDMQPKEILVMDITKPEEQLLAEMKSKTRYNIKLAEKHGVKVECITYNVSSIKYLNEFIRLTKIMAKRQGIQAHPDSYYKKMLEVIPGDILKLYVAEYKNKIIAANLIVFYGNTCTYLHGASDDSFRNVMAPYLLQWKQIQDAKTAGCARYDFGGVKTRNTKHETRNNWEGITRFKLGFAPNTKPVEFPGSYDIIVSPSRYKLYRFIQRMKSFVSWIYSISNF